MLASELPIYKDTFDLVSLIMDYVGTFPKAHKHTIGQKMTNVSLELFEYIQLANRSIANKDYRVRMFNKKLDKDEGYTIEDAEHFISSMNSYLGFFRHHKGFNIRKGIIDMLDTRWWRMCHWTAGIEKVGLNKKYKVQAV